MSRRKWHALRSEPTFYSLAMFKCRICTFYWGLLYCDGRKSQLFSDTFSHHISKTDFARVWIFDPRHTYDQGRWGWKTNTLHHYQEIGSGFSPSSDQPAEVKKISDNVHFFNVTSTLRDPRHCKDLFLGTNWPENQIFLRYIHITQLFWSQTDPTQRNHNIPISWGNPGYLW